MKKIYQIFITAVLLFSQDTYAQKQGFGLHFGGNDFYGPQTSNYLFNDKPKVSYDRGKDTYDTSIRQSLLWDPVVRLTYWFQVNRHIDINLAASASNTYYPSANKDSVFIKSRPSAPNGPRRFLGQFDLRVNYNILAKEDYIFSPYLFAGVAGSYHDIFFGANVPLGLGLNVNLSKSDDLYFNLESSYRVAATDHDQHHLQHSFGFVYWFKPGYKEPKVQKTADIPVPPPPPVLDSDGDGIPDDKDDCPSIAGTEQFNGCPDSDGDGISDKDDACPLVAGLAQFQGCPDSDGDGISDKDDKCPYVAGIASREGCPVPDKDGDGFNDDEDRCPDVYSKTNGGCPEIRREVITQVEKAAKAIFFETGKATIKKNSYKSLDAVVRILKSDPSLYADIEGHTDDVGDDASNMTLSQNRAQSVMDYMVSKGIDSSRFTAQGFGETQPVADNTSAAGRAQNRRTVIKLRNFAK